MMPLQQPQGRAGQGNHALTFVMVLSALGFCLSVEKCLLDPALRALFLGLLLDSQQGMTWVPEDKIQYFLQQVMELRLAAQVSPRQVAKAAGLLLFFQACHEDGAPLCTGYVPNNQPTCPSRVGQRHGTNGVHDCRNCSGGQAMCTWPMGCGGISTGSQSLWHQMPQSPDMQPSGWMHHLGSHGAWRWVSHVRSSDR